MSSKQMHPLWKYGNAIYRGAMLGKRAAEMVNAFRKLRQRKKVRVVEKPYKRSVPGGKSKITKKRRFRKFFRPIYRNLGKNYFQYNNAGRMTNPVGRQEAYQPLSVFTGTDVQVFAAKYSSNKTQRVFCNSVKGCIMFNSANRGTIKMTIYNILARRDTNQVNSASPLVAWTNAAYSDEGGAATDYKFLGATPFSADTFTEFYRVLSSKTITLVEGQGHSHYFNYFPRKYINAEIARDNNYAIGGLSFYVMVVIHGTPDNDVTTKSQVSTGAGAVDYVTKMTFTFTTLEKSETKWTAQNNLPSAYTVAENLMDPADGLSEPNVQS